MQTSNMPLRIRPDPVALKKPRAAAAEGHQVVEEEGY